MRSYWPALGVLVPMLAVVFAAPPLAGAAPSAQAIDGLNVLHARDATFAHAYTHPTLLSRDGHEHEHGHAMMPPITELDEAEILAWNGPTPPSYWTIDIEERDPKVQRYPWLMALHILFMSVAFFGALPAGECAVAPRSIYFWPTRVHDRNCAALGEACLARSRRRDILGGRDPGMRLERCLSQVDAQHVGPHVHLLCPSPY